MRVRVHIGKMYHTLACICMLLQIHMKQIRRTRQGMGVLDRSWIKCRVLSERFTSPKPFPPDPAKTVGRSGGRNPGACCRSPESASVGVARGLPIT